MSILADNMPPAISHCHAEYFHVPHSFPIFILLTCKRVFSIRVENSVDPDQLASDEAS